MKLEIKQGLSVLGILIAAGLMLQGCSEKKQKTAPPPVQQQAAEELPVLEQNLIYQTNRTPDPPPDYTFTPAPIENQPPADGEETSPLMD